MRKSENRRRQTRPAIGGLAPAFLILGALTCLLISGCAKKTVSDDTLTTDIQAKLYADPTTKPANIGVAVKDGVVTLSGDVSGSDVEAEAMKVANGTTGVKSVNDQMTVNGVASSNQPATAQNAPAPAPAGAPSSPSSPSPSAPSGNAAQPEATPAPASFATQPAAAVQQDPPSRVARLSYIQGNVSMEPAGANDWAPAVLNRPFTTDEYLYTDQGARAELHMDIASVRLWSQTSFGFLNLNDQTVQIKLTEGEMCFRLHNFGGNQVFEVDTPNAAVTLLRDGMYRVNVDPNGNTSSVLVRQGQAQVTGGGQAFTLNQGSSVNLSGTDQLAYNVESLPGADEFDNWCNQRAGHETSVQSAKYLPPTVVGYEDLDDNGGWEQAPEYGPVWYPRTVSTGWAPYHNGHWSWVEPWGWTWVDDASWGFAPFHYGRWAYVNNRWGWCPGPIYTGYRGPVVRPYYAPALVAFFGGAHWGVSLSIGGGGPSLGWVPLGFGEVYTPPYRVTPNYFRNVNIANTTVNKTVNITNVYNTTYINKTTNITNITYVNMRAPNAVMAMRQSAFATGRPVAEAGRPVPAAEVARIQPAQAALVAPPVAPTREALMPSLGSRPAARPPQQIVERQVVARTAPAPPVASFASRQSYLQQHAGQPHDFPAMHQAVAPPAARIAAARPAPPARVVQVHPGMHVAANAAPANRPMPQAVPENRPGVPPQPARPAAEPTRQAAPEAHGAPPNVRQTAPSEPAARRNNVPPERPQPAARPAERPAPPARPAERAQPVPRPAERPQPAARPAERPEPAARPAERPQPETRPARPAERQQPPARPEQREPAARSETAPHGTPPNRSEQHPAKETRTTSEKERRPPQ
ncbi:MAG: BON domain-containing protein [Acidobacteriaceae bacterium]|nr:BON domain-containing protein [Acidobacteriaceae bacterium]MBV9767536.1 BON domain-containing protein [Acidobacteriaceae bacterium]